MFSRAQRAGPRAWAQLQAWARQAQDLELALARDNSLGALAVIVVDKRNEDALAVARLGFLEDRGGLLGGGDGVLAVADDACLHGRRGDESEGLQPLVVLSPKHEETAGALRLARGFLVDDRNRELLETGGFVDVSPRHVTCPAANELPSAPQPKTLRRAQFGNNCAYRRWRQLVEVKFCLRLSWRPGVIRRVRRVRRRNLGLNELFLCVELGAESPESSGDGFVVGYERR